MEEVTQIVMSYQNQWSIVLDVVIAMVLGGIIGFEREIKKKPAGFRTNMIIAGAAALFVAIGRIGALFYLEEVPMEMMRADPIRILHAVIVGVGFIGAGTIIKSKKGEEVHYLTTAATIWMSAAIGITVAVKLYVLAVSITMVLLVINSLFDKLERWIFRRRREDH